LNNTDHLTEHVSSSKISFSSMMIIGIAIILFNMLEKNVVSEIPLYYVNTPALLRNVDHKLQEIVHYY